MKYVYEIVNTLGTVEYVGQTMDIARRFREHTIHKPKSHGHGKFYGRQDVIMNVVSIVETLKEARDLEEKLQLEYGLITDRSKLSKQINLISDKGRLLATEAAVKAKSYSKAASISGSIERTCDCGRTIKGNSYFAHIKKCKSRGSI